MKWFVYVFSLYLLALSGFTCKADSDCCEDEMTQQTSSNHHDDDHKSQITCVPFLACGACNSIFPGEISVLTLMKTATVERIDFHYRETAWINALGSIWQPPQIT